MRFFEHSLNYCYCNFYCFSGLLIQALSSGLDPSLLSLAASFVQRNHTARLYTVTAVIEATAGMISGPVMASVFVIGLNSGSGVGACFFLGAVRIFLTIMQIY